VSGRDPILGSNSQPHALSSEGKSGNRGAIGTCFFTLIFRGRRLSARNLGPASPVEAYHPHAHLYYTWGCVVNPVIVIFCKYLC
jgi:hypothetical protein